MYYTLFSAQISPSVMFPTNDDTSCSGLVVFSSVPIRIVVVSIRSGAALADSTYIIYTPLNNNIINKKTYHRLILTIIPPLFFVDIFSSMLTHYDKKVDRHLTQPSLLLLRLITGGHFTTTIYLGVHLYKWINSLSIYKILLNFNIFTFS